MTEQNKATEIADTDLDISGGDGNVSPQDALLVINRLSRDSEEPAGLAPSRALKGSVRKG